MRNRIRLYTADERRAPTPTARRMARKIRGYALLMSTIGQHELAAELMRRARAVVRGETVQ